MKIMITGSSGFIGKNVKEYLKKNNKDYEVFAPPRKELDCLQEEAVTDYLKEHRFDYVLHFASYGVGLIRKDKMERDEHRGELLNLDLRIFLNFAKNSMYYGKMYCVGSGAEYDKRYDIVNISEESIGKTIPVDNYGLMKYTINQMIEKSDNIYNFRIFGAFGKYEYYPARFVSLACCKVIKGLPLSIKQNVYFDYLWVDDFCRMVECFLWKEPRFHSYNMVSGEKITLEEICNMVLSVSGKEIPLYICREGFAKEYTASNKRFLDEMPSFKYTSMERAIKEVYKWYQENEDIIDVYNLLY